VPRPQPCGHRWACAERGPQLCRHMDHAEIEARLDLDCRFATAGVGRGRAPVVIEHPADAAHQSLQRGAVEAIGAAEAVHHLGLDVTLLGIADVLGQRVVADDRTVLVAALRGPKTHAHAYSVSGPPGRTKTSNSCAYRFNRPKCTFGAKNATKSTLRARPTSPNVPTDRKLRSDHGQGSAKSVVEPDRMR